MKTRFLACLSLCALLLAGCAADYRVDVDSLTKPDASAVSYSLRNANPTEADDSLRYREAAGYVRTALSGHGLFEAPPDMAPDVIVSIDYGVGQPQKRRERQTRIVTPAVSRGGELTDRSLRSREEVFETVTVVYEKYLNLSARENIGGTAEGRTEIWKVDVTSEGESNDVRKYLPVLVAASIEYVGKDSPGEKSVRIKDTDADLVFVRKGM